MTRRQKASGFTEKLQATEREEDESRLLCMRCIDTRHPGEGNNSECVRRR